MMCYRDRTYCPFYASCKNGEGCDRALTPEVSAAAERTELRVSQYCEPPACYERRKP